MNVPPFFFPPLSLFSFLPFSLPSPLWSLNPLFPPYFFFILPSPAFLVLMLFFSFFYSRALTHLSTYFLCGNRCPLVRQSHTRRVLVKTKLLSDIETQIDLRKQRTYKDYFCKTSRLQLHRDQEAIHRFYSRAPHRDQEAFFFSSPLFHRFLFRSCVDSAAVCLPPI